MIAPIGAAKLSFRRAPVSHEVLPYREAWRLSAMRLNRQLFEPDRTSAERSGHMKDDWEDDRRQRPCAPHLFFPTLPCPKAINQSWFACRRFLHARTSEYSWCNPPSIALACTKRKSASRCRDFGNGTDKSSGGSGTPGPKAECGRPRL